MLMIFWMVLINVFSERSGNTNVLYYLVDLADFDSIRQFARQVRQKEKRLDILINNAGTAHESAMLAKAHTRMVATMLVHSLP